MSSPYSYHTFIFPFVWKCDRKPTNSFHEFSKLFDDNPFWINQSLQDETEYDLTGGEGAARLFYAEFQYFYPQVRNSLYGYRGSVVKNYSFMPDKVNNSASYIIQKKGNVYTLSINRIRLRIFNTGVALLVFECENHKHQTISCAKDINNYGRRTVPPFLPNAGGEAYALTADLLAVDIPNVKRFETNFLEFLKTINGLSDDELTRKTRLNYTAGFIHEILSYGCPYDFTSDPYKENAIFIKSGLDDRMFVSSIIIDRDFQAKACSYVKKCLNDKNSSQKDDVENEQISKSLYECVFMDSEGGCTCPSQGMREDLMRDHLYTRWAEFGSLYGISAQSLVMLTSGDFEPGINSFLTMYVQMVCLSLAQRASLVVFQDEVATISLQIHDKGNRITKKTVRALMDLQERFSTFESQYCFQEVSSEEQAIEMYDKIQEFFFIDRSIKNVKSQMDGIHESTDTYLDFNFNKIGYTFTLIGALLSVEEIFLYELFGAIRGNEEAASTAIPLWLHIVLIGGTFVLSAIIWFIIGRLYRKKKR